MNIGFIASMILNCRGKADAVEQAEYPADDPVTRAKLVQRVVSWAEKNGQEVTAAARQGMEPPEPVLCEISGDTVTPDAVAQRNGVGMLYAVETGETIDAKVTAGRLCTLSSHAAKQIMLFVLGVPRGFGQMAQQRVDELGLDAQVLELDI